MFEIYTTIGTILLYYKELQRLWSNTVEEVSEKKELVSIFTVAGFTPPKDLRS